MSDYTNIEGLVIEVESDASSASQELEWLTARIEQFKTALQDSRSITTFANNLDKLTMSLSNMSYFRDTMTSFASFTTGVAELSKVTVKATVATNLSKLADATSKFTPDSISMLAEIATALGGLSAINGLKISKTIPTYLEKIAEATKKMKHVNFSKLRELTEALAPLAQVAVADGEGMRNLAAAVKTFSSVANTGAKRGSTFNTVLANIRVKTLAIITAFRKVVNVVLSGLETYGDYIETLNLFSVSMGESAEKAFEYANKVQDALGIDLTQWMKSQGVFQTLAKGFGIATDRATIMSQQLTQLAYDISSFYNISVEDAVQKVQSAFSGELEPVRRLGFDLSQAKLEAIALSLGIDKNVKSMNQAEKASLRYYALLTQVTDAQGDLARTLQSPTNQLRIFNAQITQLSRSLGMLFIPILNNVLPYLNAIVQVLKWIIDEIAALFGYTLPGIEFKNVGSGVAEGVGEVSDALDEANGKAEELKNTLASFDEINLIGSKSGGKGGSGDAVDIGSGFDFELPQYDFLGEATENRAKKIADNIKKTIAPAVEKLKDAIILIRENWDSIYDTAKFLVLLIGGVKLLTKLKNLKDSLSEINKQALGLTLLVSGITLSYSGGKALANGNMIEGILKMVIGSAIAGFGGYLVFGASGIIVGVSIAVVASIIGIEIESHKKWVEEVNDVFYGLDSSKASMDEFVTSFNTFADSFNPNFTEIEQAIANLNASRLDVKDNLQSISSLITAFQDGSLSAEDFAKSIDIAFGNLADSLSGYFSSAREVIEKEWSGALGAYMIEAGHSINEVQTMLDTAEGHYMEALNREQSYVESLNTAYAKGYISLDEYKTNLEATQERIENITKSASKSDETLEDFRTTISKGVNLDSLETMTEGINNIESAYSDAVNKMEKRKAELVEVYRALRDAPDATAEESQKAQKYIDDTNAYFEKAEGELKQGFIDTLDSISKSIYGKWEETLDVKGLDAALLKLNDDVTPMADALKKAYSAAGLKDIQQQNLKDLMEMKDLIDDVKDEVGDSNFMSPLYQKLEEVNGYMNKDMKLAIAEMFANYTKGAREAELSSSALSHNLEDVQEDIRKLFDDTIHREDGEKQIAEFIIGLEMQYPKFRDTIGDFAKLIEESMDIDLTDELNDIRGSFTNYSADFSDAGSEIAKYILGGYEDGIDITSFEEDTLRIIDAVKTSLGNGDESIIGIASNWVTLISGELNDDNGSIENASGLLADTVTKTLSDENVNIVKVAEGWVNEIGNYLTSDTSVSKDAENWIANIKKSMEEKSVDLKATGDAIRTTILTAANAAGVMSFNSFGGDVISTIKTSIDNNKSSLATPASDIIKTMYDELKNDLDVIDTYGGEFTDTLIGSMTSSDKKTKFEDASVKMVGYIGDGFDSNTSTLEGYGSAIVRSIVSGINTSSSSNDLTSAVTTIKNKVEKPFETMSNDIGNTFENMLKKLAKLFNEFKITGQFNASMPNLANFKIPGFASGGYPDSGEIFIANENGIPEYIGSMGNRTAVANNQQIVDGVAQGVYKAIKNTGIANDVKTLTQKDNTVVFAPSVEAGKVMSRSSNMYKGVGGRYS